jgi:hypothetical protein
VHNVHCYESPCNIARRLAQVFADAGSKNSAFVFIKPQANTAATQSLVSKTLKGQGISIEKEGELTGEQVRPLLAFFNMSAPLEVMAPLSFIVPPNYLVCESA